jgi:hypothetical protein
MSNDLKHQVRDYTARVVNTVEPLSMTEILERPIGDGAVRPAVRRSHSSRRRTNVLAAIGAAIAVTALVVVAVLIGNDASAPIEPAPPADTPAPTKLPVEEPQQVEPVLPAPETFDSESPDTEALDEGEIYPAAETLTVATSLGRLIWTLYLGDGAGIPSVQADIDGYVMSGFGDEMLFSDDGVTWTTTPSDPGLEGYRVFQPEGDWAVAGHSMWQSSGSSRDLLRSDGERWVKVKFEGQADDWPQIPLESGKVLVVQESDDDLQVSTNGGAFQHVAAPWSFPAASVDPTFNSTMVAIPDGGFAAYIEMVDAHPSNNERDPLYLTFAEVWTSPDGVNWTKHHLPTFLEPGDINKRLGLDVEEKNGELRASVGAVDYGGAAPREYTSTDGLTWRRTSAPDSTPIEANRPATQEYRVLQTTDLGYVDSETENRDDRLAMRYWLSSDGTTWDEIPGVVEPDDFDTGGASVGAVGSILFAGFGGDSAAVWVGHFEE